MRERCGHLLAIWLDTFEALLQMHYSIIDPPLNELWRAHQTYFQNEMCL